MTRPDARVPGSGVPRWPAGLRPETPLPYALWHVLDAVDGERTLGQVAAALRLSPQQVEQALEQAQGWTSRALRREQRLSGAVIENVTHALVSVIGPIGEFTVEDALDEVGRQATLSQLLSNVAGQLGEQQLQQFVRQLRTRGLT